MKQAVILHGTDGQPKSNWFPWLKGKLEGEGYSVWAPLLPDNHTPNRETYNDFLLGPDAPDLTDAVVIGHSSGAVEVLNLLMDDRCPHIKLGIMVSAWAKNDVPDSYKQNLMAVGLQAEQFEYTFPPQGFDFEKIKSNADNLAFIHSADDPFCPLKQAQYLAKELDASLTEMHNAKHIGSNRTELPEAWQIICQVTNY